MKSIYDLKLHEYTYVVTESHGYHITRVPGGWLYYTNGGRSVVFVSYNQEFKGIENECNT